MKTYSTKSNAKRAAKKANGNLTGIDFDQNKEGEWYWYKVYACPLCGGDQANQTWFTEDVSCECHECGKVWSVETRKEIKQSSNGSIPKLNKSEIERPCDRVWAIADEMKGSRRKNVIAACVAAGIAYYTARTQYQQWKQTKK